MERIGIFHYRTQSRTPRSTLLTAFKSRQSTRQFLNKEYRLGIYPQYSGPLMESTGTMASEPLPRLMANILSKSMYCRIKGVYCYEPEQNLLKFLSDKQLKAKVGTQGDIETASYVLLLTAKMNDFPFFVGKEEKIATANATAGCIGENIYLMASALKLGTRLVASINVKGIREGSLSIRMRFHYISCRWDIRKNNGRGRDKILQLTEGYFESFF